MSGISTEPADPVARMRARRVESDRIQRFDGLYSAHHPLVMGYVMRRTTSDEDAADAIAETFLTAWRRLEDAPDGDAQRLWLYAIARRTLANQRRGERRRNNLALRIAEELAAHPAITATNDTATTESTRETETLRLAFDSLADGDRELLALNVWESLEPGEIATVLGCSANAARIRLHRARKRLRDLIGAPAMSTATSTGEQIR